MFMRRACLVSVLCVSCFDGSDAHGLPCNSDADCGNEMCIGGVCGGATSSSNTMPSTTETESMTTNVTGTDTTPPTTSETDPSTTTSMTMTADTSSGSESSTTGGPEGCQPLPAVPAVCERRGKLDSSPTPVATAIEFPVGKVFAVVTGDFVGDWQPDIAVVSDDNATHIIQNDVEDEWIHVIAGYLHEDIEDVDPYDFAVGDFSCDGSGNLVFVYAGQGDELLYVGYSPESESFFENVVSVPVPPGTFSLAAADFIAEEMGYPDVVLAGSGHVTVLRNTNGFSMTDSSSATPIELMYREPWDTLIIGTGNDTRLLVPAGDQTDLMPDDAPWQSIYSFRLAFDDMNGTFDVVPATTPTFDPGDAMAFGNPWALATGDFDGDGDLDIAVGERHINLAEEGTDRQGTIRFFSYEDTDVPQPIGIATTGYGLNSLAAADMNCDDITDLVIGLSGVGSPPVGASPQVLFGATELDGLVAVDAPEVTDLGASSRIAIADFDDDGQPEAAIGDFGANDGPGDRVVIVDVN